MKSTGVVLLATGFFFSILIARQAEAAKPDIQAVLLAPQSLAPGASGVVVVTIEMRIGPGWHVNSHKPKESYLIPTRATLKASGGTVSEIRYPQGVEKRFEFADQTLSVYEGTVRFTADLTAPDGMTGKISLTGALSYQACDEHACYPPATIQLAATVVLTQP